MDCIAMVPVAPPRDWSQADADTARHRHAQRSARLIRVRADNEARLAAKAVAKLDELDGRDDLARAQIEQKKAVVQAAIDRARARRATAMAGGSR
jgi:electron transport complex protein RnfB